MEGALAPWLQPSQVQPASEGGAEGTEMRGEQNTTAGCAPKSTPITTFLGPCAILGTCFLLPSTLRTEALIPI